MFKHLYIISVFVIPDLRFERYVCICVEVRGTCDADVRAEQRQEVAASLNSDDVFVLETPAKTYLWTGKVRQSRSINGFVLLTAITASQCVEL